MTRKRPSWRHDGDRAVLSEKATRTNRHSRAVGFPSECKMKKSLLEEAMMLATRELKGGGDGGPGMAGGDGGGP